MYETFFMWIASVQLTHWLTESLSCTPPSVSTYTAVAVPLTNVECAAYEMTPDAASKLLHQPWPIYVQSQSYVFLWRLDTAVSARRQSPHS